MGRRKKQSYFWQICYILFLPNNFTVTSHHANLFQPIYLFEENPCFRNIADDTVPYRKNGSINSGIADNTNVFQF